VTTIDILHQHLSKLPIEELVGREAELVFTSALDGPSENLLTRGDLGLKESCSAAQAIDAMRQGRSRHIPTIFGLNTCNLNE